MNRCPFWLVLDCVLNLTVAAVAYAYAFPVRVSENCRGLVGQHGAPLVCADDPRGWARTEICAADGRDGATESQPVRDGKTGDVPRIPKVAPAFKTSRDQSFHVLTKPMVQDGAVGTLNVISGLSVQGLGKAFQPDPARVVIAQTAFDRGGNTSARPRRFSGRGYLPRSEVLSRSRPGCFRRRITPQCSQP